MSSATRVDKLSEIEPPAASRSRPKELDQMGGFAKGLAVIEAFGRGRAMLTIADIARTAGLDRASARRCLHTLVNAGYATSDGRYFQLTPRILRLGHVYLAASLPKLLQPSLDQLANVLKESCSASVLDGSEIVYIARAAQHRIIGVGLHAGSRLPAYCTSMGRVLLAALPPEQARSQIISGERQALTAKTLTDPDLLLAELQRIREQGYALIDQEVEQGSRSIAVPIFNMSGRTIAAVNVGVHISRKTVEQMRTECLPRLLEMQASLADILP